MPVPKISHSFHESGEGDGFTRSLEMVRIVPAPNHQARGRGQAPSRPGRVPCPLRDSKARDSSAAPGSRAVRERGPLCSSGGSNPPALQVHAGTERTWLGQDSVPSLRMAMMSTMKGEKSYCQMRAMSMKPSCNPNAQSVQ